LFISLRVLRTVNFILALQIDEYIEKANHSIDHNSYLNGLSELIQKYFNETEFDKSNFPKAILDKELPNNCQKLIAYCLLRILNINSKIIDCDKYYKILVMNLFDNNLKEVYVEKSVIVTTFSRKYFNFSYNMLSSI